MPIIAKKVFLVTEEITNGPLNPHETGCTGLHALPVAGCSTTT